FDYGSAKKADTQRFGRFFHALLDRGVYLPPSQFEAAFVSLAHGDAEVRHTLEAVRQALASVQNAEAGAPPAAHRGRPLRRGYGGVLVEVPAGARLEVDGTVALSEPSRGPRAVPSGHHAGDLLLADATAVLARADVAEGQAAALALGARRPASGERRSNDAL